MGANVRIGPNTLLGVCKQVVQLYLVSWLETLSCLATEVLRRLVSSLLLGALCAELVPRRKQNRDTRVAAMTEAVVATAERTEAVVATAKQTEAVAATTKCTETVVATAGRIEAVVATAEWTEVVAATAEWTEAVVTTAEWLEGPTEHGQAVSCLTAEAAPFEQFGS